MASLRQHGKGWQARIRRQGYPDITKSFQIRQDAERWARALKSELDKGQFVSIDEAQRSTLGDLIGRYLVEVTHGRETREARTERSLDSARLAVLEAVGFSIGLMSGGRTRGRRSDRMAEVYPELQALLELRPYSSGVVKQRFK